jgi:small GTP-binding protein
MTAKRSCVITLVGSSGVGKSTLCHVLRGDKPDLSEGPTIGANFCTIRTDDVNLEIWDTAGQERFSVLLPMYLRKGKIILLCFDKYNIDSIKKYEKYINEYNPSTHLLYVATKLDSHEEELDMCIHLLNANVKDVIYTSSFQNVGIESLRHKLFELGGKLATDDLPQHVDLQSVIDPKPTWCPTLCSL